MTDLIMNELIRVGIRLIVINARQ